MQLTREKIKRMFDGMGGGGAGGSMDASMLAGYATQAWVEDMFVSKAWWKELFIVHGKETVEVTVNGSTTSTETEIILEPNEVPSVTTETDEETGAVTVTTREITSIEAKVGLWTDYFLSALGLNSGGGGGGTSLNEPLASINNAGLAAHPTSSGQTIVWNGSAWVYGNAGGGGGGTGTVTSVGMTVPTGFAVSGSPITGSGTLALSFASGYSLPTTAKQSTWDTAYTNSHTHDNKSVLDGITAQKVADWDDAIIGLNSAFDYITTLQGYFTDGVANNAARLSTVSKTLWGNTYWTSGGVPTSVGTTTNPASLSNVTNITMSGKITIGGFVIEVVDGKLKFNGDVYATGGVSALGQSSGGSSLVLTEPLLSINTANLGTPSSTPNQTLVWTGSQWTYGTIGGGVTLNQPLSGINSANLGTPTASGQTLIWNGTVWTYGIPTSSASGTFWGNSWTNGQSLTNTITINNGYSLSFKDSGGNAKNVVTLNSSNMFALGYGTRMAGYTTDIQGAAASTAAATATAIQFKVGLTDAGVVAMRILKDGTVYVPTTSPGLRIGDALITYTSDGLKVSALNGTGAMNLYATGGVSALGMSSGGSSSVVPVPTSSDNGKVLTVANGEYVLTAPTTVYSGSSAPSSTQGQNGDVYLQTS